MKKKQPFKKALCPQISIPSLMVEETKKFTSGVDGGKRVFVVQQMIRVKIINIPWTELQEEKKHSKSDLKKNHFRVRFLEVNLHS